MIVYAAGEAAQGAAGGSSMIIMLVLMFALMYFLMIRPQKKQEKQIADMRNSLMIGDEIVTNGGIIGRICAMKDDIITLEINKDRTKLKIYRWAVREVVNPMPRPEPAVTDKNDKNDKKQKKSKKDDSDLSPEK